MPLVCTLPLIYTGGSSERRDRVRKNDAGTPVCVGWSDRPGSRRGVQHRVYTAATDQRGGRRRQGGVGEVSDNNLPRRLLEEEEGEEQSAFCSRIVSYHYGLRRG